MELDFSGLDRIARPNGPTRADRLEQLKAQRDELNRQLKELRIEGMVSYGKARLAPKQSYVNRADEVWALSYASPMQSCGGRKPSEQYRALFTGTRNEAIDAIPGIINDLAKLYNIAKEYSNEKTV